MGYYDYGFPTTISTNSSITGSLIWTIISIVLAIVGGIALYFTVFSKKNAGKYKGFMAKIYDLVTFKYFLIDDLFRMCYLICVIGLTLGSFVLIGQSFLTFILVIILGNIGLRISFELFMLFTELCYNVREINKKTKEKK